MEILNQYLSDEKFVKIAAPMVRYSKLPFRVLVRGLGADLAYTPMIMANSFAQSESARRVDFTTLDNEGPVIVQLGTNDIEQAVISSQLLYDHCSGIDINSGCPQRWAIKEGIGCQLLRDKEKLFQIIKEIKRNAPKYSQNRVFSVSAKIRLINAEFVGLKNSSATKNTIELIRGLSLSGCDYVTIHCRYPSERDTESPHYEEFNEILTANINHCQGGRLPIVINGGFKSLDQMREVHEKINFQGAMVANGLLEDPAIFLEQKPTKSELRNKWLDLATTHNFGNSIQNIQNQLLWFSQDLSKSDTIILKSQSTLSCLREAIDYF